MCIMFARTPPPDAPYWPGREWLGALDAIAWPALGLCALAQAPFATGLVMPVASVILSVSALLRLRTALMFNQRYRFTTWRLGRVLVLLILVGLALKFAVAWR